MEVQRILGLDFEELGLVLEVVIPQKFKALVFAKYDGVSFPKLHLCSYVRKIQPHTRIEIYGCISFKIVCQGLSLNGSTSWREPVSETGKILLLLSTSSISIIPTLLLVVLNFRVCPWVQEKVLKIMLKNGETWPGEFNSLCLIES